MTVAEKLRYLRTVEGHLRGLNREMTQKEVAGAIRGELKSSFSQPYLSQLESGRRKHMTNTSRLLLSKFFRVHPGYLVEDPEGFQTELATNLQLEEEQLDLWLRSGSERFRGDQPLAEALVKVAGHEDTRKCILLMAAIVETPGLVERLAEALNTKEASRHDVA